MTTWNPTLAVYTETEDKPDPKEYHVVMGVCCAVNLDAPDHNEADKAAIDLWAAIHKALKPVCRSWLVSIATEEVEDEEEHAESTD